MSLLLEALKKAEKAKEEAQKRAREGEADGTGPAHARAGGRDDADLVLQSHGQPALCGLIRNFSPVARFA